MPFSDICMFHANKGRKTRRAVSEWSAETWDEKPTHAVHLQMWNMQKTIGYRVQKHQRRHIWTLYEHYEHCICTSLWTMSGHKQTRVIGNKRNNHMIQTSVVDHTVCRSIETIIARFNEFTSQTLQYNAIHWFQGASKPCCRMAFAASIPSLWCVSGLDDLSAA